MGGLFDGTPLERPVTCERCGHALAECTCPRNAAGDVRLPADQPLRIRREKRRGKVVTVIAGFDAAATDLRGILSSLKSACAAGGTINDDCIEVQGDQRERAMAMLKEMGYPVKLAGG
jgi:translation initiation factor 1